MRAARPHPQIWVSIREFPREPFPITRLQKAKNDTFKFYIVERGRLSNPAAPKKFYPSSQSSGRLTLRELAESGSDRPTLTVAEIIAAGESFLAIVPKELAKGNIVELGDFGSFWLRTTTEGAETAEEVRADQISTTGNVTFPHLNFKSEVAIIWIRSV